jgi:hypothetical protein
MATPNREIGWGAEENLLSFISKQLGNLTNVTYNSGSNSSTGPQGPQGVQGIQGPQGTQGLIGIQGETGATGPTGAQGVQGDQGLLGPVGPAGLNWKGIWTSGTSYVEDDAVGYNGASWFCILPTSGTTTPDLDTTNWALLASQGAQGQAGSNGAVGATGPTGAQGTIGLTGPEGPQGEQGVQGEQGIQGIKGVKGDKGDQGIQGIQGVQGPSGVDGAVGPAGLEWQGAWASGTSYVADDAVGYDGASWFCILPTSETTPPDLDTTHWALLASQGAQGQQGEQGVPGEQGPPGSLTPITASAPLTGGTITTTGTIGISAATNLVDGYITKEAFVTFTNKENSVNKQNSLAVDGTGTKFPTVDAVNLGITNSNYWTKTGNDIQNNTTGGVVKVQGGTGAYYDDALRTVQSNGTIGFRAQNGGNFYYQYGYGSYSSANTFGNASGGVQMSTTSGNAFISNVRIKYLTDLSLSYDDRTLVDKGYVNNRLVVETAGPYLLGNTDSGGIVIFTASTTLTIPTGLANGFECTFVTLIGVTLTVVSTGNTLNNAAGTTMAGGLSFTLKRMIAANTFISTGNL